MLPPSRHPGALMEQPVSLTQQPTRAERLASLQEHYADRRIIRGASHKTDNTGRELACLLGGRLNLAHANYDTLRAQLLLVGQSQFIA